MLRTRRSAWVLITKLLFFALAGLLLYLAVAGLNWTAFLVALRTLRPGWVVACLVFELTGLLARSLRWNLLLAHRSGRCVFIAFVGETIGDLGNTFLPARAGEIMRTLLVARKLNIELSFVIGTAATERVSDAIFLALVAFITMLLVPHVPVWLTSAAIVFFVLGSLVLLILFFLPVFHKIILPLLHKILIPVWITDKIQNALNGIWLGSRALISHPSRMAAYAILTVVIWAADAVAFICITHAFGSHLLFIEAMLFVAALGLSSAVPSTPGYIGIFQFVAVSVLTPFGISRVEAIAIILVFQVTIILQELLWGGLGWMLLAARRNPTITRKKPADGAS